MQTLIQGITENWTVWFVSVVLVVAAVIDGAILKVPNWLTFPFIVAGWIYCTIQGGFSYGTYSETGEWVHGGLLFSLLGTFVGMMLLLVLRNRGGMGAGDVKLLAGVGAWLGASITMYVFAATAIVGGIMGLVMIATSGNWHKHYAMAWQIVEEWKTKKPAELAAIARERKPTMYLLPYGIPMAIGAVVYFAYTEQLFSWT